MKIIDCIQGSPEWYAARLGKATASCFGKAIAGGAGKTRTTYMIDLIAERMTEEPQNDYTNAAMQWGSETEPLAREYYEALNGVSVRQVGFIERDADTGASPDGLVGKPGMIEIKCPNSATHIQYILDDRVPPVHKPQVQGQLWVAERDWVDFISYDPRVRKRPYFCKRVYRDEDYIEDLKMKIEEFLADLITTMEKLTVRPY